MQALKKTMTALGFSAIFLINCTQPNSSKTAFNKGSVDRGAVQSIQQSDLTSSLSSPAAQTKINEILEGNLLDLVQTNLKAVQASFGNDDVEYNGNHFYDLEIQLSEISEYMLDSGVGQDYKIKDILEEEGINVGDFKKGIISQDFLNSTMEVSSEFIEKGMDVFVKEEIDDSTEFGFRLADCPSGGKAIPNRMRARSGNPRAPAHICPAALPPVDCSAAGKAEKAGAIVGGTCGAAAALCVLGAIPSAGAACTGLAVCGAAAGAVGAGGAAAGAAGGC